MAASTYAVRRRTNLADGPFAAVGMSGRANTTILNRPATSDNAPYVVFEVAYSPCFRQILLSPFRSLAAVAIDADSVRRRRLVRSGRA